MGLAYGQFYVLLFWCSSPPWKIGHLSKIAPSLLHSRILELFCWPVTHATRSVTLSSQISSTYFSAMICNLANCSTLSDGNSCPTNLDPLTTAKSLQSIAMGLAYVQFYVIRFRCPIHREKLTIASQKPLSLADEKPSTDFTAMTQNLTRSISPSVKTDAPSTLCCWPTPNPSRPLQWA